jgi:hypothetical protein
MSSSIVFLALVCMCSCQVANCAQLVAKQDSGQLTESQTRRDRGHCSNSAITINILIGIDFS